MEKNNYHKNWYEKNKEKAIQQSKDWYKKNKKRKKMLMKDWYQKNKEKILIKSREWYNKNKDRKNQKSKIWYINNKEKHNKKMKKWRENNKEKAKELSREWYHKNKERVSAVAKIWYSKNKTKKNLSTKLWYQKNKSKIAERIRNRSRTDPTFRLIKNLRRRTLLALKGKNKSASTMNLLGIQNIEFLWIHLEKQFKPGMTRENHGEWHVDHIKPCSSFDLTKPEEQAKCFHYTNLQPLWASENLSKGNRIS